MDTGSWAKHPKFKVRDFLGLLLVFGATAAGLSFAFGWAIAAALFVALIGWGTALYFLSSSAALERQIEAANQERALSQQRIEALERTCAEDERRMKAVVQLNRSLTEAQDERSLMESALSAVTSLVGALGCSFVPVDEWQQPLPAFTYGQLPEPVLNAWSTHLATRMLHERCGNCKILESNAGACPLHPAEVGNSLTVFCLPLSRVEPSLQPGLDLDIRVSSLRAERTVGVLHLYLPAGQSLDAGLRLFLDGMLHEISLAYELIRMRKQEQVTLRQLQMLRAPEGDFTASLGSLLDALTQALEADFVFIRLRASNDERLSNLVVQRGDLSSSLGASPQERLISQALEAALHGQSASSAPEILPVWLSLPLFLPDRSEFSGDLSAAGASNGSPLGVLIAGVNRPYSFRPRQQAILQTVAAQAALLLENERMLRSMEYKLVIQERARLAREIHDGLAQTLAFLKLQAAQMQSYLAQGNLDRLSQVLKDNYQTLAEAYLDTRQAIDNLRLTPQDGLERWLDRILNEFEYATDISVTRGIQPLRRPVSPEVQAQLIRIVQEALSNVRKHARARHVRVSLREWQGEQVLEVSDDGLGFAAEDVPEITRHGLRGMRERAELIGAEFQIISQAEQGTTMRLVLPASFEEEPST